MSKTPHTDRQPGSTQVKIWLDDDLIERLDERCTDHQRSRAFLVNIALRQYLNRLDAERDRGRAKRRAA